MPLEVTEEKRHTLSHENKNEKSKRNPPCTVLVWMFYILPPIIPPPSCFSSLLLLCFLSHSLIFITTRSKGEEEAGRRRNNSFVTLLPAATASVLLFFIWDVCSSFVVPECFLDVSDCWAVPHSFLITLFIPGWKIKWQGQQQRRQIVAKGLWKEKQNKQIFHQSIYKEYIVVRQFLSASCDIFCFLFLPAYKKFK